jgi:hypothetical protein
MHPGLPAIEPAPVRSPAAEQMPFSFASCLPPFVRSRILCRSVRGYSRKNSDHHFSHVTIGTDPIIDKLVSHALSVKLFNQLDQIVGVAARAVKFLHQSGITFLHLDAQQIKPWTID